LRKKIIKASVFLLILIITTSPLYAENIGLVDVEGRLLNEVSAWQSEGSVLLDLRDLFFSLGFDVSWQEETQRLEVDAGEDEYKFRPGKSLVAVNGENLVPFDPPHLHQERLYLEVNAVENFMTEELGKNTTWNPSRSQLQLVEADESEPVDADERSADPVADFLGEMDDEERAEGELLVVIDPGHGGRDPGAIGPNGLMEKEVALDISHRLADRIESEYEQIETHLTREEDVFVSLEDRTRIANELNADMFISIHANGHHSQYARGFEVFTLSGEASDPSAEELAETENSVLKYEGYDADELDDVAWILHQLRATVHTRDSQDLARQMVDLMEDKLPVPNRGVKQAPLWVLKDAQMPAVLVEAGFLSNPQEERRLQSSDYQESVVEAIAKTVYHYLENNH